MELMKYIEKARDAANEAYKKYEAALMQSDISFEKLQEESDNLTQKESEERIAKINADCVAAVEAIREEFKKALDEQETGYMKEVSEFYTPNGSKIDLNDMNLIKSGLKLSLEDIHEKIMQYSDNMTMLLIYSKYVQENKIELVGDLGAEMSNVFRRVNDKGDAERKAFKRFVTLATAGLMHPDKSYIYVWQKLDDYKIQTEIDILKATPVIDKNVVNKVHSSEEELTKLEEARGLKGKEGYKYWTVPADKKALYKGTAAIKIPN